MAAMMASRTTAPKGRYRSGVELLEHLRSPEPLLTVELRPPPRDGARKREVDRWIEGQQAL